MSTAASTPDQAPVDSGGLFTRQASGLVRELGIPAAIGISLASVGTVGLFINFNAGLSSFSQVDMYLPLLFAGVVWIVAMFSYRYLVDAMPRAGGEYLWLSRVVSPAAGSALGIAMTLLFTYSAAANAHFAATFAPFMFTALGAAFKSSSIANIGNHITSNLAVVLISCGIMLGVGIVSMFSLKRLAYIVLTLSVVQLIAIAVLALLLADHSHQGFVNAFARYSHYPHAYQAVLALGKSGGMATGANFGAMVAVIPFMWSNFNGVLYSNYTVGELRKPGRTYLYASGISLAALFIAAFGIWALMRHTVGLHFMQAQTDVANGNQTGYAKITGLDAQTNGLGYGLVLAGDPISKILMGIAVPCLGVAAALAYVAVPARVLFAIAFDRIIPVSVARVSARNNAPMVAIGIVLLFGLGFCVLTAYTNLSNIIALFSLLFALILVAGGVATTLLAHRRPDLVKRPGKDDVERIFGLPGSTWIGGLTTALGLFIVILVVAHSNAYGKFSPASVITLLVLVLLGPAVYVVARAVRRQRDQIDLGMSIRELPPE